jgi:hypothetical protein
MTHTHPEAQQYADAAPELLQAATRCESRSPVTAGGMYHRCSLPASHAGSHECSCGTTFWSDAIARQVQL